MQLRLPETQTGCAIGQAVNRLPVTEETRVPSQDGGQSGTGKGILFRVLRFSCAWIIPPFHRAHIPFTHHQRHNLSK
jgi:hypothetical protein